MYYQTVILIFRPFLVVHFTCQRNTGATTDQDIHGVPPNTGWLLDACLSAVNAAISSIDFLSNTFSLNPITKVRIFLSCFA